MRPMILQSEFNNFRRSGSFAPWYKTSGHQFEVVFFLRKNYQSR